MPELFLTGPSPISEVGLMRQRSDGAECFRAWYREHMPTTPADLAATLVRRHRQTRDEVRAHAAQARASLEAVIGEQGKAGRFRRAFLIGSLAHGSFGAGSDIDVVLEGLAPDDVGLLYDALVSATHTEVDVLRLEELPPSFQERVEREGILLHGT
jgi:predicted nucleotidyltransferase